MVIVIGPSMIIKLGSGGSKSTGKAAGACALEVAALVPFAAPGMEFKSIPRPMDDEVEPAKKVGGGAILDRSGGVASWSNSASASASVDSPKLRRFEAGDTMPRSLKSELGEDGREGESRIVSMRGMWSLGSCMLTLRFREPARFARFNDWLL